MTAKSKAPTPEPTIPASFRRRMGADGGLEAGYAFCLKHGVKPNAALKHCRSKERLEWQAYCKCGGVAHDEKRLSQFIYAIATTRARLDRAVDPVLRGNLATSILSFESNCTSLQEIIAAAGEGSKINQATRSAEINNLQHQLDALQVERKRYDDAKMPVPAPLITNILETEGRLYKVGSEFSAEGKKSKVRRVATQDAKQGERQALGTTLLGIVKHLGEKSRELYDTDPGKFFEFPRSAPADGDALFAEAERISNAADHLGCRGGLNAFRKAAGPVAEHIIEVRLGLLPLPSWARPRLERESVIGVGSI